MLTKKLLHRRQKSICKVQAARSTRICKKQIQLYWCVGVTNRVERLCEWCRWDMITGARNIGREW